MSQLVRNRQIKVGSVQYKTPMALVTVSESQFEISGSHANAKTYGLNRPIKFRQCSQLNILRKLIYDMQFMFNYRRDYQRNGRSKLT